MITSGPTVSHIAWLIYLAGAVAIFIQPRYGIYLLIFFTLVGDSTLMYWFPFVKNFSSSESLFYLNDAIIFSPLELYIVLIFVSWLGRGAMQRKFDFYRSELFWPVVVFLAFVVFGLIYGVGTGGDLNIALWESRAIFYMAAMLILASNLLTRREHLHYVMWAAMIALFIEGLIGSHYFLVKLKGSLAGVQAITEHSAAIHMNTLFVFAVSVWLYQGSAAKRLVLPLMIAPVLLTYLATQRRASYIALIIALIFIAILLFKENRRAFWLLVPPAALIGLLYLGAFWNSGSAVGQPARAVKSVIADDQADTRDQYSNIYRQIENLNLRFTMHQRPLTGVGFGQKFYTIWPLADISFFEWWEYLAHNSIIWIWLKTGVGGFVAMLYLIGTTIMVGVRTLWRMPRDDLSAIALTGTLYIVMHFIYAYVDISWDAQSMVYVGMMMGILSAMERIVGRPVAIPARRWPWQPMPEPSPSLLSFPK